MAEHDLKTWPEPFDAIERGDKCFEFRKDDREPRFEVGDTLVLRRWDPHINNYTGRCARRVVTYIARGPVYGIPRGYCVMSTRQEHQ